jgi:hypothetical protein
MRFRVSVPVLVALAAMADAETPIAKLIVRPELFQPMLQPGTVAQEPAIGLHIEILKGDGGVNMIKDKMAVKPVVEVRDRNNLPVVGIPVTFTAPNDGPSVIFLNGSRSMTVVTDTSGQATVVGMTPVNEGVFQIGVSASYQTQTAITEILLTNVLMAAASRPRPAPTARSPKMMGALIGVAAAAAVGIGVGLSHHSSSPASTPASSAPSATIGLGSGGAAAGPPH